MSDRQAESVTVPKVGLAYASYVPDLIRQSPELVDYVEIPFERLCHEPATAEVLALAPAILHCASLSIAGVVPARDETALHVRDWAVRTKTPWVGEHLAFISAPDDAGGTIEVGYTVAPPLNAGTLRRVLDACERHRHLLGVPLILENPPQYFATPGSTMDQATFMLALCDAGDVDLLLDLSHLWITAHNTGVDPMRLLERFPLERVREVHLSGATVERGLAWDDHGVPASSATFELFDAVLARAQPAAVTLEYNWAGWFGNDVVCRDLERIRRAIAR